MMSGLWMGCLSVPAWAHPLLAGTIEKAVQDYLYDQLLEREIVIEVQPLDPRLKLTACDESLSVSRIGSGEI